MDLPTFAFAKPEYLNEFRLRRLPWFNKELLRTVERERDEWVQMLTGSFENTGPSGTRFTMKELFPYKFSRISWH
jgi:hypothetical protein